MILGPDGGLAGDAAAPATTPPSPTTQELAMSQAENETTIENRTRPLTITGLASRYAELQALALAEEEDNPDHAASDERNAIEELMLTMRAETFFEVAV